MNIEASVSIIRFTFTKLYKLNFRTVKTPLEDRGQYNDNVDSKGLAMPVSGHPLIFCHNRKPVRVLSLPGEAGTRRF